MFYALSEQLETVKGVKIHHFELRQSLVQYLRKHPKQVNIFGKVHVMSWTDTTNVSSAIRLAIIIRTSSRL